VRKTNTRSRWLVGDEEDGLEKRVEEVVVEEVEVVVVVVEEVEVEVEEVVDMSDEPASPAAIRAESTLLRIERLNSRTLLLSLSLSLFFSLLCSSLCSALTGRVCVRCSSLCTFVDVQVEKG
jgi:hypothetical protein